jgi:tetratricopeptide (TPR) repeat protein
MRLSRLERGLFAVCFTVALLGCGNRLTPPPTADAYKNYNAALESMKSKDWKKAGEGFSFCVEKGGLNADLYTDALVRRAICLAQTGDIPAANADLDKAERAADLAPVYSARALVLKKAGKTSEATAMLAKAKKLNAKVEVFSD